MAANQIAQVKKREHFQDLMSTIRMKLRLGETEINFYNFEMDFMIGRNFSGLDLDVALNEFRKQGWEITKGKGKYVYQFSAAPVATVTSVAPMHKVVPLSPQECSERTDAEVVDSIVAIINLQLGNRRKNKVRSTIYRAPFLSNYDSDMIDLAIKKFEEVGWSVGGSPSNDWYFQIL